MFESFFMGVQQDLKIFILAPVLCTIFRAVFIAVYHPGLDFSRDKSRLWHCFRYGFWWGMDFNAYVFLISMITVSIPGAFLPAYYAAGDIVRAVGVTVYLIVISAAFIGRMLWYYHYHDVYNHLLWLGKNADKKNLLDIFFNQDHGALILLGLVPLIAILWLSANSVLLLPSISFPVFDIYWQQMVFNTAVVLSSVAFFYYFRFGGTFAHVNKPEWDEVPTIVKADVLLGKATMDDLVNLEIIWHHKMNELMTHSDDESIEKINHIMPKEWQQGKWRNLGNPLDAFKRKAKGAKIKKPKHIFLIVGESYSEAAFENVFADLNIANGCKALSKEDSAFSLNNFLSGGEISQPSIVGLVSGIYDIDLELNEKKEYWEKTIITALPVQMKKLGYRTVFWYGGALNWGSLQHYLPGAGFDEAYGGNDFCPADSPKTWLGVYDHIFLDNAAKLIKEQDNEQPVIHVLYTTSFHGPYRIPVEKYGYDFNGSLPEKVKACADKNDNLKRKIGCFWYMDMAIAKFCTEMRNVYPDSMFVVTGDHTAEFVYESGVIERTEPSLRERSSTMFFINHPDLKKEMFVGNRVGCHMNILPTIIELIADKGYEYTTLFPPLTEKQSKVVTPHHWLTEENIGKFKDNVFEKCGEGSKVEAIPLETGCPEEIDIERQGWNELSGYMVRHNELLRKAEELV